MFEAARLEPNSLICVTIFVKLGKFLFFVFASHLILCVSELIFITCKNPANCCSDSRHLPPFPVPLGSFHFSKMFAALQPPFLFHAQVFRFFLFCFCFSNLKSTDTAKRKKSSWFCFWTLTELCIKWLRMDRWQDLQHFWLRAILSSTHIQFFFFSLLYFLKHLFKLISPLSVLSCDL